MTGEVARVQPVPSTIRALDRLGSDYIDVFATTADDGLDATPEQWARATIEGSPAAGRFVAWQLLCRLRLEAGRSPDLIAGWRITERGDRWITVEASSRVMTANMIFHVDDGRVSFATLVRYDEPSARLVWTPVSAVHRRVAPGFLAGGARRLRRDRSRT